MRYIIVDVEGTNSAINDVIEIIEFGYTIIENDNLKLSGGSYIKPEHSRLDDFITEMTGITEAKIQNAPTFKEFISKFLKEHPAEELVFVSWGDYDSNMIDAMCSLAGIEKIHFIKRINLKREHKNFYGFKKERGLQRALNHARLGFEGQHHSGIDDAYNTARLFIQMKNIGWKEE